MIPYNQATPLPAAADFLWLAIIAVHPEIASASREEARSLLLEGGFPERIISAHLASRAPLQAECELQNAVQAVLGWQHGWCADCEPVSRREDMDHHEDGCAYWEAVQALAKLVGLTRWVDHETVEQIIDQRWYRRHRFGGKIERAWPEADAAERREQVPDVAMRRADHPAEAALSSSQAVVRHIGAGVALDADGVQYVRMKEGVALAKLLRTVWAELESTEIVDDEEDREELHGRVKTALGLWLPEETNT